MYIRRRVSDGEPEIPDKFVSSPSPPPMSQLMMEIMNVKLGE